MPEPTVNPLYTDETRCLVLSERGLTIRAHMAAMMLAGIVSRQQNGPVYMPALARIAVDYADALIAALNPPPAPPTPVDDASDWMPEDVLRNEG
jgi:hypothetical protein